jgi:hypothetical protein
VLFRSGTWTVYTAPFGVSAEGRHTLRFYSVDNAGNSEEVKSAPLKIDLFPPITTFSLSGDLGNNNWYISNVTLVFTATDTGSGVNHTYYKLHAGDSWIDYTTPPILADGIYSLFFYSVDHAGNTEEPKGPYSFKIDRTPPIFLDFTATPENAMKNKWLLAADLSDPASGVARVEFYVDDHLAGTVNATPWEFHYSGNGKTAQAIAYDNAGNSAMSNQVQTNELTANCQPMTLNQMVDVQSDTSVVVNMQHMLHGEKLNS